MGRKKRARLVFKIFSGLIACLILFLVLEITQRVLDYRSGRFVQSEDAVQARKYSIFVASDDPIQIYEARPDYVKGGIRYTESSGILRPDDVPAVKPAQDFRIAVLGDSITMASIWRYEDRYTSLLETQLNADPPAGGKAFQVLNFAVDGYRTIQEARRLERTAIQFDPDLVVLQYCLNDPGSSNTPTVWFQDPPVPPLSHLFDLVLSRLRLLHYDARRTEYVPVVGPGQMEADYWYRLYEPDEKSWKTVVEGFQRIAACAKTRNAPVLLVIWPFFLEEGWLSGGSGAFHDQVSKAGRAVGFEILDLIEAFRDHSVFDLRERAGDIFHPNLKGHQMAAKAIESKVRSMMGNAPRSP